jgi:hypothetical protein
MNSHKKKETVMQKNACNIFIKEQSLEIVYFTAYSLKFLFHFKNRSMGQDCT